MGLTLAQIRESKEILRKNSIKPFNGYFGLGPDGLFEIKSQEELVRLAKRSPFDVKNGTLFHPL